MYLDSNGNIVQQNGDGGDTAQRTGFLECALKIRENLGISNAEFYRSTPWTFDKQWRSLFIGNKLIRNPKDWNDPKDTSRDQTTPMLIAFGLNEMGEQVGWLSPKGFLVKFYQNKDVASPENMGHVDRALRMKPYKLADLWALGGVIIRLKQAEANPDDVGDDLNTLLSCAFSCNILPTEQARKTFRHYLKNRAPSLGTLHLNEKDHVIGALKWYFRPDSGGNPELAEIWRPIVDYYRSVLNCPVK